MHIYRNIYINIECKEKWKKEWDKLIIIEIGIKITAHSNVKHR